MTRALALLVGMLCVAGARAETYLTIDDEADLTNAIAWIKRINEAFNETYSQPVIRIYTNKPCAVVTNVWSMSDEYWEGYKNGALWAVSNGYDACSHTTNWAYTNITVIVTNAVERE